MNDEHQPRPQPRHLNGYHIEQQRLGVVTEGSFNGGLTVRLNGQRDTEGLRVGSFVVLEGRDNLYFSLITDMRLRVTDQALSSHPPTVDSPFVSRALAGTHTFATVEVRPNLMLEDKDNLTAASKPAPARNIPMHFAALRSATESDFDLVFGEVSATRFALGTPPTMDIPIPIDLEELVTRSNGIFGQSGSGKSVLTRLLLFGLIKSRLAAPLVFDMHSEYARQSRDDPSILGLVDLFGAQQVRVFSLDQGTTNARAVLINPDQIQPGDIELLRDELNLRDTFSAVSHQLGRSFGNKWFTELMQMRPDDLAEYCKDTGVHQGAAEALKQKLALIFDKPYVRSQASVDWIDEILMLLQRGTAVIIQFGKYDDMLDYMLVANIVSRRIHERYTEIVAKDEAANKLIDHKRIVIVLEEAHKFLKPEAARQTIFGKIAREMRKYAVTLLVVDQRPSDIDPEVLSQIGTRITGPLTDPHDIDAVLTGVSDRNQMRGMLATLQPKQECLIVGHAVPMPIMLRTRLYKAEELKDELRRDGSSTALDRDELKRRLQPVKDDVFG